MKYVVAFTWLDLLFCAAFAIPFISDITLSLLNIFSLQLSFAPVEIQGASASFFINLAGFFGVLWNIAMLKLMDPNIHKVDLVARLWLIGLILFHIVWSGLSPVFSVFIITEIVGGVLKMNWLRERASNEL